MDTQNALLQHIKRHEKLMPLDIIKFLYQAEFGCGHLIPDYSDAHERFCAEWDAAEQNGEELYEQLSPYFCRLNLGAAKAQGLSRSMVLRMFFESSYVCGNKEHLRLQLTKICETADKGELCISADEMRGAVAEFEKSDMPMLSHTEEYRKAYNPSYRVVKSSFCVYMPLFIRIFKLFEQKPNLFITIDGMAAAGKSTLGALIQSIIPCNLIHADSFFLPRELRTPERLVQAGGLLHYERINAEVLDKLKTEDSFNYRIFNCSVMDYDSTAAVLSALPTILEGSYSTHNGLCKKGDITVFLKTSATKQGKRILNRSGKAMLKRFVEEWIPAENAFFEINQTKQNSEFVFET